MSRLPLIFAALASAAVLCGGAKIASDGFVGHKDHDARLVGIWKGQWNGKAHRGGKSDIRLFEDGTGTVLGRPVAWDTEEGVLHIQAKGKQGAQYASVAYLVGRRGSSVAFGAGPEDTVPLMMAKV